LGLYSANLKATSFFCDDIWTVGSQPVLCASRCVCWHAVLLEDEFGGQPAIALRNDNLAIIYKENKSLFKASL